MRLSPENIPNKIRNMQYFHVFLPFQRIKTSKTLSNIGIKCVFPCINIRWVPREVLKTEGAAFSPSNMFDRYYCIKVSKKSILERYFDV